MLDKYPLEMILPCLQRATYTDLSDKLWTPYTKLSDKLWPPYTNFSDNRHEDFEVKVKNESEN